MSPEDILLCHILQCRPIDLVVKKPSLTHTQNVLFKEKLKRLHQGEPLQYILGEWDFYGLTFKLTPDVLIPRPETECLVEKALEFLRGIKDPKILDIGTGSGNIAITLAKRNPLARVYTVDISAKAQEVARFNAKNHEVESRVSFVNTDILGQDALTAIPITQFDLIISNPPYIPTQQMKALPRDVQQEPALALDGGADGLVFYRTIIKLTTDLIYPSGCLMMEFGDDQHLAVSKLCSPYFRHIQIFKDLAGRERFIQVQL